MSLVNDMLRDLQQRKATDSEPLTGLRAVPAWAPSAQSGPWWIVAVSVTFISAATLVWFRSEADAGDRALAAVTAVVEVPSAPVVSRSADGIEASPPVAEPEYLRLASLETNRLDYYLKAVPLPVSRVPAPLKPKPVVVAVHKKPAVRPAGAVLSDDASAVAVKKPVAPAIALRRDGLAALRAGRPVAAERQFARLVAADPQNPESHLFLHAALKAQSRSEAARTALHDGLAQTADRSKLAQLLANELLAEGRIDDALAVLTTHRPPGHADLDYEARLAAVNQRAGHHDFAARLYESLVARQPANATWRVGLAISQEAQGHTGAAAKSFATASAAGTLDATLARYAAQRLKKLEAGT